MIPRFDNKIKKTYVQDADKPYTGQIQGEYYVGAPAEFDFRPPCLDLEEAYEPGRPLGVAPFAPYRRPYGSETTSIPYYDYGFKYPAEGVDLLPGLARQPVGANQLPQYYGADEFEHSPVHLKTFSPFEHSVDTGYVLKPGFEVRYGQPVVPQKNNGVRSIPKMVPRPNVPFWGQPVDEYQFFIGQPKPTAVHAPMINDPVAISRNCTNGSKVAIGARCPEDIVAYGHGGGGGGHHGGGHHHGGGGYGGWGGYGYPYWDYPVYLPTTPACPTGCGYSNASQRCVKNCGKVEVPCAQDCPKQSSAPMKGYGVTKVVDTIIQDEPDTPFPEPSETVAYNPYGAGMTPYGRSVPTISKSKTFFPLLGR